MSATIKPAPSRPDGSGSSPNGRRRRVMLDDPLLKPEQAAALLAVRTSWIYEAVRDGRLPCLRVGRHIRFTRALLEQWLSEH
jgi:excisionase family DNA binding protein